MSNAKTLFIAVCGRTNAGKSSLVNLLVGEKIAIVSDKPQTTRTRINGILTNKEEGIQYVFVDTPGFHKEKSGLSQHMHKSIRSSVSGVDVILFLADCKRKPFIDKSILEHPSKKILILNKIDLVKDKTELLILLDEYNKMCDFAEIIPISTVDKTNIEKIMPLLKTYADNLNSPESEGFYYDSELPTDQPEKIWLSELIREKLLQQLREELPHGIAVQIESMEFTKTNRGKKIVDLSAVIMCEKSSHKGMIIGRQGSMLKKIGELARLECEDYFESKVNLKLWVKVAEDWRNRESLIHEFGLKSE
ncbi:MAG: GTPase Era [Oscillospiraceae bacterium]|nr:GTPase Era [Oscillospiraceae bacterium]